MAKKSKGKLSINSENIFPIIKKWLYSDHDIFLRELVSNGCDAITKLKKLELMGQADIPEGQELCLHVTVSPQARTIQVEDKGLGMTAEEVKTYINQIAFSGAADFLEKYKDKANEDQIIGHFGLGFYSSFMVADKVTIDTLSWEEGAEAVHWESDGGTSYTMGPGDRSERGTLITLYLSDDSREFSNEYRVKEVLEKYCAFMPYPIYFENADNKVDEESPSPASDGAPSPASGRGQEGEDSEPTKEIPAPVPVNDVNPLWLKNPSECTEEEYKGFYKKLFRDWKDPLFTIHLNMDYPFNLKGLLYFPKLNLETEPAEGTIKLFANQVFIADNIKEVIPEFLLLLKGVIDCPDLPLNVSRSALQNDGFVRKISDYITKKVADKLTGLFNVERENYEKYWEDISPFIKYGCLKDDKFSEKIRGAVIYKNLEGKYVSLDEYLEAPPAGVDPQNQDDSSVGVDPQIDPQKEDDPATADKRSVIYYVTDPVQQATYVEMFKAAGQEALLFTHAIDEPFITRLEMRYPDYKFCRIDSDVNDALAESLSEEESKDREEALKAVFSKALGKVLRSIKLARFKDAGTASLMTYAEESRRMQDMFKMYGMDPAQFPTEETLVLNSENRLVQYLEGAGAAEENETASLVARQLYDLALMAHKPLTAEESTAFAARSLKLMELLIQDKQKG
ncbi:MAG: molecular chaperone HtpG [Lachnospiraceae bacterium]|nr:molecular chaperone HtpG [Lachnospiraceae bacterium]